MIRRLVVAVATVGLVQCASVTLASPLWTVTPVETGLNNFVLKSNPSATAWAPDGTLGLAYYDFTPHQWVYRTFNGTSWSAGEVIATMAGQGANSYVGWQRWVELQYDGLGRPRVAYLNNGSSTSTSDDRLNFAYNDGAGWVNRSVGSESTGGQIGLHLDGNGNANISYYNSFSRSAKFALRTSASSYSSGTIATVESDSFDPVGSYGTDVIRDSAGNLHVVYFDASTFPSSLYSEMSTNGGTSWGSRRPVFQASTFSSRPAFPSLALDGNGNPAVAFVDLLNDSLYFSSFTGSSWSTEQLPLSGIGLFPTGGATLDYYAGTPYIAFIDSQRRLNVASKNASGDWQFQFVANTSTYSLASTPAYPFMNISPNGQAAISFYDYTQSTRGTFYVATANLSELPEPSSLVLLGMGGVGLIGAVRRRRPRAATQNNETC